MANVILRMFLRPALRWRGLVLVTTVILTVLTLFLSSRLGVDMKWTNLLPEQEPLVKEYIRVTEDYPLGSGYIITVKAATPLKIEEAVERIIERVDALEGTVTATYGKIPEDFLVQHGLRTLKPKDLKRSARILEDVRLLPYLTHLNDDLEREFSGDADRVKDQERQLTAVLAALETLIQVVDRASGEGDFNPSQLLRATRDLSSGNPYYLSLDKKMGIIPVAVSAHLTDFGTSIEADRVIGEVLAEIRGTMPDVEIGTTGMIPISRDEMESIGPYTLALSFIALLLVYGVLAWNYRSATVPLLGLTPIIIGTIWALGFYRLTVINLNILTSAIMLVLIGLGIDFAVHLINRFYEERAAGRPLEEALETAVTSTGKGVLTGGLTTALAFFALMAGETKGLVEFGFCAGSGILIILLAMFLILPSLLVWQDRRRSKAEVTIRARDFEILGGFAGRMAARKWVSIGVIVALAIPALLSLKYLDYEYNIMETEPVGLKSIELQDEILDRFKLSTEMAMTTVDSVELSRQTAKLLKKRSIVGDVDSIDRWIPAREWVEPNDAIIAGLRENIGKTRKQDFLSVGVEPARDELTAQLQRLLYNMIETEELAFIGGQDRVVAAFERITGGEAQDGILSRVVERFKAGNVDWQSVNALATEFSSDMKNRVTLMVAHDGPVTEEMMPPKLQRLYKNPQTGLYLLQVYPKKNLYEHESLLRFIDSVGKISPSMVGTPSLLLLINDAMIKDGVRALLAAAATILLLLLLDLRSLAGALLASIPLFFGALWMLTAMVLFDIKLNFINIGAIPIIIGIGVDNGIHILHRWRQEGMGGLEKATAKVGHAILMTTLTTGIGFGSMAFYTHRGMASMGCILVIGVFFCFLATILVLPSFGSLVERWIMKKAPKAETTAEMTAEALQKN